MIRSASRAASDMSGTATIFSGSLRPGRYLNKRQEGKKQYRNKNKNNDHGIVVILNNN